MKPPVDKSYQLLAARYIRRQIKQLTGQIEGIHKAEDIEFVHRARVASRRLRQALVVFDDCFPGDRVGYWLKEVRRLGRGLGAARDKDVQIAWVSDVLARLEERPCVLGVARVLVRCQRKRERVQPEVLRLLRQLLAGRALHEMLTATKKLTSADGKQAAERSPVVLQRAEWHIGERVKELRAFEPCLASPDDQKQHHAMRIAAKRLRYTMELFKPVYEGALDRVIEAIKQVQSLLGDVHDCDVWIAQLDKMLQKQSKRFVRYYRHAGPLVQLQAGIDFLKHDRQRRREELFSTLVQFWHEQTEAGLWDELAEVIGARGPLPDAPAAAVPWRGEAPADRGGNGSPPAAAATSKRAGESAGGSVHGLC